MGEKPDSRSEHEASIELAIEDEELPTPYRKQVLREAYKSNLSANLPPYKGVELLNAQELDWIFGERGWSSYEYGSRDNPFEDRPNLSYLRLGQLTDGRGIDLSGVDLIGAYFPGQPESVDELPDWSGALFHHSDLSDANLAQLTLEDADMRANMPRVVLQRCNLSGATLEKASLINADLSEAKLQGANLSGANLRGANLNGANLRGANLQGADLTGAILTGADLQDANLTRATLSGANLCGSRMNVSTSLAEVKLSETTLLADVVWNNTPLIRVDWGAVPTLGNEARAQQAYDDKGEPKSPSTWEREYAAASRAYRSLAVALRSQGLNDYADNYSFRAQLMQRKMFRWQKRWGSFLFSWFLFLISGYGYRIWRILVTYVLAVLGFAFLYCVLGVHSHPHESGMQALWDSCLVSLSAIHGRTTFEQLGAWSPAAWTAAVESVCGIVIEGVFVAMLIQRFFTR